MGLFNFLASKPKSASSKGSGGLKFLNYEVACKSCLKTDGIPHMLAINNYQEELYENQLLKSDYLLEKLIKDYRVSKRQNCPNCFSSNLEINEITLDGQKVIVGQNVNQIQIVLIKYEDGKIEIKTGGSTYLPKGFLNDAFDIMKKTVQTTNSQEFEEKGIGNVRLVVSTRAIGENDNRINRIEQFKFAGFDKKVVLEILESVKLQMVR